MITTQQDLCTRALRMIGVVGQGDVVDPNDLTDAAESLQEMIDAWAIDRLSIYYEQPVAFPLVVGQQAYTIGPGGNINVARPIWFGKGSKASIQNIANPALPLEIPIEVLDIGEWQRVPVKLTQSALPLSVWYDNNYAGSPGLGMMNFYPVPNTAVNAILYLPTALTQFTGLTIPYDMPPGYVRAIRFNLAVELMGEFQVDATKYPTIVTKADIYLGDLRAANIKPEQIGVDFALIRRGERWNWYTGQPN